MTYFSQFPKMLYDIKGDRNYKLIPDIFRRIKVRSKLRDEISLLDSYTIEDGDKPETVAFKVYGSTDYFWVVCLMNNIRNVYYDWPLDSYAFEQFLNDKYDEPDGIHHYEKIQLSGKQIGDGPGDNSHKIEVNSDTPGAGPVTNFEYERRLQDNKREIKILDEQYLSTFIDEFNALLVK
jgi:hypothetical protein|tara:strand:+ start:51 stop:587 length:537 start_codon:yes stop_codon:yes gene_type:complete